MILATRHSSGTPSSGPFSRRSDAPRHAARQRLSARDFDRQGAEFQLPVAALNGFTALGIPVTEAVGSACPGKGDVRPSADLCNRAFPSPRWVISFSSSLMTSAGVQKSAPLSGNRVERPQPIWSQWITARPSRASAATLSTWSCVAPGPPRTTISGSLPPPRRSPVARYQVSSRKRGGGPLWADLLSCPSHSCLPSVADPARQP